MIEFKKYKEYTLHNKAFNTVFTTIIVTIISLFLGTLFYIFGWLEQEWGVLLLIILLVLPIITFMQKNTNYEGVVAYYFQWGDLWHGLTDSKRIKDDYAKSHGVKNWNNYFKEHNVDLRWNYHVNTKYMERLANSRNSILIKIAEEYAEIQSALQAETQNLNNRLATLERLKNFKEDDFARSKTKLKNASTGAQKYDLENQCAKKQIELNGLVNQITDLKCELNNLNSKIQQYHTAFVGQKSKIEQDYKLRSNKYARAATHAIEKIGLKYEVDSLVLPDYWINNPTSRKEI